MVRHGKECHEMARYRVAWHGIVSHGMVWRDTAWPGMECWHVMVWQGTAWHAKEEVEWEGRLGAGGRVACRGRAWRGATQRGQGHEGLACHGKAWHGMWRVGWERNAV